LLNGINGYQMKTFDTGYLRSPALACLDRQALALAMVASLAMNLLLFALPLYSLQIFDRVLTSRSIDTLWLLTFIVIFALSSAAMLDAVRGRVLLRMGNRYALTMGPRLLDAAVVESAKAAEPSAQLLPDMQTVRGFLVGPQGLVPLFDAPLAPLFLFAVYVLHAELGIALLIGIVVLIGLTVAGEFLTAPFLRAAGATTLKAQRYADSAMANAEAVEAMGMRDAICTHWQSVQDTSLAQASRAGDRALILAAAAKWTRWSLSLMITAYGAWLAIHDEITIGTMVAANMLAARGLGPLEAMIGSWKNVVAARTAVDRINFSLNRCAQADSGFRLPAPRGDVSIERLVYVPPGAEHPTIKGISFRVPAGALVGLIGPSGAGKSTLAKLICGVWQSRSGTVRLDGADVYTWRRSDWGLHCGYLPQDVELFAGTVRDNIARFRDAEDSDVIAAARMAGMHEAILRLSKGYDTQIGFGGAVLSGGQRQRLGLARALLGNPKLLVLDEPNSNLDAEGERALLNALHQIRLTGATVFMISHRRSLLAGADLLAVMIDGQIQHFGPRPEVLHKLQVEGQVIKEASRGHS